MKIFKYLAISIMSAAAMPALAHEVKGPHGGRMVDAGDFHVEVVIAAPRIDVFLSDAAGKPVSSTGSKGTAILIADGKPQRITLEAAQDAQLTGATAEGLPANAKGVVQLTLSDGRTLQAQLK